MFPSDWTEPDVTITVEEDGTPTYDEDEEPKTTSTTTSTSSTSLTPSTAITNPTSSTSASQTSSISWSTLLFDGSLCAQPICTSCLSEYPLPSTPPSKGKRYVQGDMIPKVKRVMPEPRNAPYNGNMVSFILGQLRSVEATVSLRDIPDWKHCSSALFRPLMDEPFSIAVKGLFGCTSLVVASTKGVWMSHFWEGPSFNCSLLLGGRPWAPALQQIIFQKSVLDYLGPGDGTPEFPGLQQYIGPGKAFGPDTQVEVSIITPLNRQNPVPGNLLFPDQVAQIARSVTQMFGGDWNAGTKGSMASRVGFLDYRPRSSVEYQLRTASGKALFQYDPVQARCINPTTGEPAQFAARQTWFQNHPRPYLLAKWIAWPEQQVPATPTQAQRRDLLSNNDTNHDEQLSPNPLAKRQELWTAGAEPSLYPAYLSALANNDTVPETTAILVGPSGPVTSSPIATSTDEIVFLEQSTLPSDAGTIIYGCTTTTTSHTSTLCAGSLTPVTTLFPQATANSVSCDNQETFSSLSACELRCVGGECREFQTKKAKVKERCVGCGVAGAEPGWRCFCPNINIVSGLR